jgi:hypothetical protein
MPDGTPVSSRDFSNPLVFREFPEFYGRATVFGRPITATRQHRPALQQFLRTDIFADGKIQSKGGELSWQKWDYAQSISERLQPIDCNELRD